MLRGIVKYALCGALLFSFTTVFAADMNAIKKNMAERLEAINSLKASGSVGENNLGFLEFRVKEDTLEEATIKLVDAENADRKTVYEEIGKKNKVSAEATGKQRARQIAERAKVGEWLQNEAGEWYQKKAEEKGK